MGIGSLLPLESCRRSSDPGNSVSEPFAKSLPSVFLKGCRAGHDGACLSSQHLDYSPGLKRKTIEISHH